MTPASIIKIVASASVLVAACSAALVFGVKREEMLETGPVTAMTRPSETAPSVRNESSSTLAASEPKVAALTDELGGVPGVLATDESVPSFDIARLEGADAVIAGRAAPGAIVDLLRDGERLDRAVADASGQFVMVPPRLPAGSYELTLSARLPDGTVASSKQGVKITVSDTGASSRSEQPRAEYIPESTSQARSQSQPPPLLAAKRQAKAASQPAQANPGSSASEEGASSRAVEPRQLTKVVSRGDSLWHISRITYGDGTRYAIVYQANRDRIRNPNLIHPGQILVLPIKR
jgi:nucleoid-associated protein YgaU